MVKSSVEIKRNGMVLTSNPDDGPRVQVVRSSRPSVDIYGGLNSLLSKALKGELPKGLATNQPNAIGIKSHLMNKAMARTLKDFNDTHSTCLRTKKAATVGLGHRDQEIHRILDPLCRFSWQDVLNACAEDFEEGGDAFLEVTWDEQRKVIQSLGHVDATRVFVNVEQPNNSQDYHYLVTGDDSTEVVMAKFDDLIDLKKRFGRPAGRGRPTKAKSMRSSMGTIVDSEIIHVRNPTNRSRWYGYPDYLSATPSIELVQCMTQCEFDFYFNRAVPEFILFVVGKSMGTKNWEKLEEIIQAHQGMTNAHKTAAIHIPGTPEDTEVQLEKLAMESSQDNGYSDKSMTLSMKIATAHGVPPILANILLPGKIGAANEGPNALLLLQKTMLGQSQRNWSAVLAGTLGSGVLFAQPEGAPVKLTREQFIGATNKPKPNPMDPQAAMGATDENGQPIFQQPGNGFCTILDGLTLGAQDTLSRMKEPLATSDRNPEDGLLGGASDRKKGDRKKKPGR
jgi:portal protein